MRVNIWIRKEDEEAWNNVADKPQWIHEGLATGLVTIPPKIKTKDTPIEPSDLFVGLGSLESNGLCKIHGIPLDSRGKCLQKGCKNG